MSKQNEYEPDYLVSSGETLSTSVYELRSAICENFSGKSFSSRAGKAAKFLEMRKEDLVGVCDMNLPITPAIAAKLEKLDKPAHFWLNLERQYQEDRRRISGISPWRKVEDDPPPKDGDQYLWRMERGASVFVIYWVQECKEFQEVMSGNFFTQEVTSTGEWCSIPGGGE
jgi:hypothetical protein